MCDGSASADVSFDRLANTLSIHAQFDGLPYRPHVAYEYNPSTPFNQYPDEVQDGRWQMWLVGHYFTQRSTFYYDGLDGHLIGNEHDIAGPLPPSAFPVELPVLQMLCTDFFESDPNTLQADVTFEYDYNNILDMLGSAGALPSFPCPCLVIPAPSTSFPHPLRHSREGGNPGCCPECRLTPNSP